ncbi:MAG: AAA family ATPase, partial [candidate division Zixibacteria bacterium]|nr:AAA family ATPase [candidate division Zixibacteria bacterium]
TLSLDVDQLSAEKERLMGLITGYQSEVGEMERMAQKSAENYNSLSVKLVEERSAINELTARITHLQEVRHEIAQTRTRKTQEIENAKGEVNAASEEIAKIEVNLKTALDHRSELSARETTERQKREEIALQVKAQENSIREARGRKDKALEESHSRELKLNQLDNDRATLIDHIQEEYGVDLANYALPEKDEQSHKDNRSPEEAEMALKELKERVKAFGPVNLLAIEEFESASERFEYLDTQMVDLLSAKATLQSTIAKINRTAREMFTETFNKARKNFQLIFTELFTGGECDLKLVDESDPLESEIEIIAKPKGKKLVTITQMSGGERALTAISILFSLYLVKPSPFCILDEIDAPLDDANCHRFLKIIRRFSAQTQFIIITHNKITMQAADTLYGVTMETPGVSKLVSVDFGDVHDDRQLDTGSSEQPNAEQHSAKPRRDEPLSDEPEIPAPVVERMKSHLAPQNAPDAKNDDLS